MDKKTKLLGQSTQTPVENKNRHVVTLPGRPSKDFIVTARCRIINVGARTSFSASDLNGETSGNFSWSTDSTKIRLINSTGPIVAVEALTEPSSSRDQEKITVTRTSGDGSKQTKFIRITVARVTFGPTPKQSFGYDDFDTPEGSADDHVSVRSNGSTMVAVKIEGGAVGSDFDFVCDDPKICTVGKAPALRHFDLLVQATTSEKLETILRVKASCPSQPEFAKIFLNIYPEKFVRVVVAKIEDPRSRLTALTFSSADYASHQQSANEKLRDAVVRFEITNSDSNNKALQVEYDTNSMGALAFDINRRGGKGFDLIDESITGSEEQYRVAIIKNLKSYYYLSRPAKKGDTEIHVRGSNIFSSEMILGTGDNSEDIVVKSNSFGLGYLESPLTKDHPLGEPVEFPAIGWSTDPIIVCEGEQKLEKIQWTVIHEVGHRALELLDVIDLNNLMHFSDENSDNKMRYCPRILKYKPDVKENQWETVPRVIKRIGADEDVK